MSMRQEDYAELASAFTMLAVAPPGLATRSCIDEIQQVFSRLAQRSPSEDILAFDDPAARDATIIVPTLNQCVLIRSLAAIQKWDGTAWVTLIS